MRDIIHDLATTCTYLLLQRYLVKQQGSPNKVTQLGLFRSGEPYTSPPQGWNGISTDFNIKRGGDYLYVVWKSQ